jgi:nucleotide-binding universal stress UspA family protein
VRSVLEEKIALLTNLGVPADRIDGRWFVPGPGGDLEQGILREAEKLGCETIVVGRRALPWYRELFHSHVADRLARHAQGQTLWIVDEKQVA